MNPELDFEKRWRLVREVIETLVLTGLMFFIIRFAIQNFYVEGMSMEPNLHDKELILVDKWSYLFHAPARGDVIVFVAPPNPSQDYVKRIIGVPGDVITIQGTTVIVDGVTLHETYVDPRRQGNPYSSFSNRVVPPDSYFVLGDNRAGSSDSRDWGFVPRKNIIGRAALVYWPLGEDNNGFLPDVSSVFAEVHQRQSATLQSSALVTRASASARPVPLQPDQSLLALLFFPSLILGSGRQAVRKQTSRWRWKRDQGEGQRRGFGARQPAPGDVAAVGLWPDAG
ncbi:signal peptidase I [Thermogemmatispora carboxidivorans]|uniref:signal peptidase I n=1 Tax=Thermogemmatispora carboxidivorans TaxID=1382306 RepID=UPI0006994355|nr:signal peptidase I [Thermogemmatispora carboxidivorans]